MNGCLITLICINGYSRSMPVVFEGSRQICGHYKEMVALGGGGVY